MNYEVEVVQIQSKLGHRLWKNDCQIQQLTQGGCYGL